MQSCNAEVMDYTEHGRSGMDCSGEVDERDTSEI